MILTLLLRLFLLFHETIRKSKCRDKLWPGGAYARLYYFVFSNKTFLEIGQATYDTLLHGGTVVWCANHTGIIAMKWLVEDPFSRSLSCPSTPCCQHRTVPDFDVAAICQTPGRSWWVRLPSNIKEKGMGCLANRRKGVLVFWWLGRDGTDRTGACTGEKN